MNIFKNISTTFEAKNPPIILEHSASAQTKMFLYKKKV